MSRILPILAALLLFAGCTTTKTAYLRPADFQALKEGMTEREVVDRIGKPTDINVTQTAQSERAQFVYPNYGSAYESAYVYFVDARLTMVQY